MCDTVFLSGFVSVFVRACVCACTVSTGSCIIYSEHHSFPITILGNFTKNSLFSAASAWSCKCVCICQRGRNENTAGNFLWYRQCIIQYLPEAACRSTLVAFVICVIQDLVDILQICLSLYISMSSFQEKLMYFPVCVSKKNRSENETEEGLGSLPRNISSVSSLLLFNTTENL